MRAGCSKRPRSTRARPEESRLSAAFEQHHHQSPPLTRTHPTPAHECALAAPIVDSGLRTLERRPCLEVFVDNPTGQAAGITSSGRPAVPARALEEPAQ
ncbi:hypothetical protein GCM10010195_49900 [Kitasatospora griseola]|nr:hypothetical protein GCM10010195_49900 [Kitasatospora griseola]